ncbi:MAG: hypothetical protein M3N26_12270, partial [Pseudomonadota bacterium]|nr:hypothetical protein [Pseudomonadota bacterium]
MTFLHVPTLNARYWAAIALTSVFGANMGDFVSRDLHKGHVAGLPYIFAVFLLILVAARYSRGAWEGWFWLAIITLRTAATNL